MDKLFNYSKSLESIKLNKITDKSVIYKSLSKISFTLFHVKWSTSKAAWQWWNKLFFQDLSRVTLKHFRVYRPPSSQGAIRLLYDPVRAVYHALPTDRCLPPNICTCQRICLPLYFLIERNARVLQINSMLGSLRQW